MGTRDRQAKLRGNWKGVRGQPYNRSRFHLAELGNGTLPPTCDHSWQREAVLLPCLVAKERGDTLYHKPQACTRR